MTEHEKWLAARRKGIGGSDAACILGCGFKSNYDLWLEKTGRREPEDISDKPVIQYGKAAEQHIRALFALDNPQYLVDYDEYAMIANMPKYPWLFATLDGELTEIATGRKGVLEIKTTEIRRAQDWDKWSGDIPIPQVYYIQVLHQLLATGYDFVIIRAQVKHQKGIWTKDTIIERKDVLEDMQYLLKQEIEFWGLVKTDKPPNLKLPTI